MIFCYIIDRETANRGFLYGPYCPIYGIGGLLISYTLIPFRENIYLVFILSILISSLLEYFTAYILEKTFNQKWWDYSEKKFNIHGRVCLSNSFLFGIMGVLTIYIIHPYIVETITTLESVYVPILAFLILAVIVTDTAVTIKNLITNENG